MRPWHRCFPVNFAKFLETLFLTEHLRATASAGKSEIRLELNDLTGCQDVDAIFKSSLMP